MDERVTALCHLYDAYASRDTDKNKMPCLWITETVSEILPRAEYKDFMSTPVGTQQGELDDAWQEVYSAFEGDVHALDVLQVLRHRLV